MIQLYAKREEGALFMMNLGIRNVAGLVELLEKIEQKAEIEAG